MSDRTPEFAQVIREAMESRLAGTYVMRPGRIESFDAAKGLANIKPLLKEIVELDTGEQDVASVPVVSNVPVYCFGGGDFLDTAPVAKGDYCILLFADRSLDLWKEQGGEVDPVDPRRHDATDAIALVGLRAKPNKLAEWDTARRVLGKQGGPRIALANTAVHLGVSHNESATEAVMLGTKYTNDEASTLNQVATDLQTLATQLNIAGAALNLLGPAPIVPGAVFVPIGAAITAAGAAALSAAAKLTTFAAGQATRLSTIVKVK